MSRGRGRGRGVYEVVVDGVTWYSGRSQPRARSRERPLTNTSTEQVGKCLASEIQCSSRRHSWSDEYTAADPSEGAKTDPETLACLRLSTGHGRLRVGCASVVSSGIDYFGMKSLPRTSGESLAGIRGMKHVGVKIYNVSGRPWNILINIIK